MAGTQLPKNDSLSELQSYIQTMNIERGFNAEDPSKKLVLLVEEIGELARAIREVAGIKFTETTHTTNLKEELGDVQIVLLGLANILKIDMLEAVRDRELKNSKRTWK